MNKYQTGTGTAQILLTVVPTSTGPVASVASARPLQDPTSPLQQVAASTQPEGYITREPIGSQADMNSKRLSVLCVCGITGPDLATRKKAAERVRGVCTLEQGADGKKDYQPLIDINAEATEVLMVFNIDLI